MRCPYCKIKVKKDKKCEIQYYKCSKCKGIFFKEKGDKMEIEIKQERIKDRKNSFWYEGVIAKMGQYLLLACGDIRVAFPEDNFKEWHKYHHAVEEAYNKEYKDKDLAKLEWGNNNWFEVIKGYEDENGTLHIQEDRILDVEYYYDEGIKMLKRYVEEKEYGEILIK